MGLTKRGFAAHCGVHSRRVTDWEKTGQPSADNLVAIANKTNISLDWLLGLIGEDGKKPIGDDDRPVYRTYTRTSAELADDLAVYLTERALLPRGNSGFPDWAEKILPAVDGRAALDRAVKEQRRFNERLAAWFLRAQADNRLHPKEQQVAKVLKLQAALKLQDRKVANRRRSKVRR